MPQIINKFQEIKERLKSENPNPKFDCQNITEAIERMNEEMEEVRRNFQVKDKKSQISAVNVILTA